MNVKKLFLTISLVILLACGVYASILMASSDPTYDGSQTDVVALYENPQDYDNANADGVASIIVNENLDKTAAQNVVFSVVFNFRGYDTMGESFILIAAIAGCLVVLRKTGGKGEQKPAEQKEGEEA